MPSNSTDTGRRNLRVVIVDDSWSLRAAVRELLEHRGYVVIGEAENATSAFEALKWLEPDLVLIDVGLPGTDGMTMSSQLTLFYPELAVLLMSASGEEVDEAVVAQVGARGFVHKSELATADLARMLRPPSG
jgi:DNA-binding NarL/FixJ family response regulator